MRRKLREEEVKTLMVAASFTAMSLALIVARPSRCGSRRLVLRILPIIMLMCGLLPGPAQAQFAQQGPKLIGTDTVLYSRGQGYSVSLSGDGNTAILGAPGVGVVGAARVFTRSGGVWAEQQTICPFSCVYFDGLFGFSVSLSADGNTAIIGAPEFGEGYGRTFVYVRSGGVWTPQACCMVFADSPGPNSGSSVSLSADGNTAIIGGPFDEFGLSSGSPFLTGAAWVLRRSTDGGWTQQAKLIGRDVNGMFAATFQGSFVSLSGDGNTAISGGYQENGAGGAGLVFTYSANGGWTQQAILVGGDSGVYVSSVSLSYDGNTAIVGNASGAVVYARSNTASGIVWNQEAGLPGTGADAPLLLFGPARSFSVSLSADGNTAMVGTSIFTRSEVGWIQQELPAGTGAVGDVAAGGFAVALSGDGHTALVGGPGDDSAGAAWVYSEFVFPGMPTTAACVGRRTAGIARKYGGFNGAAAALGFSDLSALKDAILTFCQQ